SPLGIEKYQIIYGSLFILVISCCLLIFYIMLLKVTTPISEGATAEGTSNAEAEQVYFKLGYFGENEDGLIRFAGEEYELSKEKGLSVMIELISDVYSNFEFDRKNKVIVKGLEDKIKKLEDSLKEKDE
ncbi:hypothetical protein ACJX0J_024857, partial [Zea mays]